MLKKTDQSSKTTLFLKPLLFGLLSGTLCTLLLLFGAAALCVAVDIPAGVVSPMAFVACAAGAALGGFVTAKIADKKGWLYGLSCGACLFLLLTLVGFTLVHQTVGEHLILNLSLCLACGCCGGILGVNLKRNGFSV